MDKQSTKTAIEQNDVYNQILIDSFGGVMYNVANREKYDTDELLALWNSLTAAEREAAGGIMRGAIAFVSETA